MDLQLFLRVLWRFRLLLLGGIALAFALAFLSFVRVSLDGSGSTFTYREPEQWASYATLWVTPDSFPWGSSTLTAPVPADPRDQADQLNVQVAPTEWFSSLAVLYAQLATSDGVREIRQESGPIPGTIEVAPVLAEKDALPFIRVAAISPTPAAAEVLAQREIDAFRTFLERQQEAGGIPAEERVIVKVSQSPQPAVLFEDRSKTRPIMVFLSVLIAVIGLAFILENLRPRVRPVEATPEQGLRGDVRRSA